VERLEDVLLKIKMNMKVVYDLDGYRIYPPQYLLNSIISYLIENREPPWYHVSCRFKLRYPPKWIIRELEALKEIYKVESNNRHVDIIVDFHRDWPWDPGLNYP
jgi:hypothetical protein